MKVIQSVVLAVTAMMACTTSVHASVDKEGGEAFDHGFLRGRELETCTDIDTINTANAYTCPGGAFQNKLPATPDADICDGGPGSSFLVSSDGGVTKEEALSIGNVNCCNFGFDSGIKVYDSANCGATAGESTKFCTDIGDITVACADEFSVSVDFPAATGQVLVFRKAGNFPSGAYPSNFLTCGILDAAGTNVLVENTATATSHIDICWDNVELPDTCNDCVVLPDLTETVECGDTLPDLLTTQDGCGGLYTLSLDSQVPAVFTPDAACSADDLGSYVETYTYSSSNCDGGTFTRTVTVADTTDPDITCGAATNTVNCGGPFTGSASATDNCGTPSVDPGFGTLSVCTVGTVDVTNTATDACGNEATCMQTFSWDGDNEAPMIACAGGGYNYCGSNSVELDYCTDFSGGTGTFSPVSLLTSDNCAADSTTTVEPISLANNLCSDQAYERIYEASDNCGNLRQLPVSFAVDAPEIVYSGPSGTVTAQCDDESYPQITVTKTLCSETTTHQTGIVSTLAVPTTCGTVDVPYAFTDVCGASDSVTVNIEVGDDHPPIWDCLSDESIECPGGDVAYCGLLQQDFTPVAIGWSDNCAGTGSVGADAITSSDGNECQDTVVTRTYEGPSDGCGNTLNDYMAQFTIPKPAVSYELSAPDTVECGADLAWEVTKTLCGVTPDLFDNGSATVPKTCGSQNINIPYNPTCGDQVTETVSVSVSDTIAPEFDCIQAENCPAGGTVCELPDPVELCANDECQGRLCDTPDPITVGCAGGAFDYTWQVAEPECSTLSSDVLTASYTVPSRIPSFVGYTGEQPTPMCEPTNPTLPVVCALVPVCGGQDYTECSDASDILGAFYFGGVDKSRACDGVYSVEVTYTSEDECEVTDTIEFESGCCCETAFAVHDNMNGDTNCFLNEGFNRWGWTIGDDSIDSPVGLTDGFTSPYDEIHSVYAGAGQCDLDKGVVVGTVRIEYLDDGTFQGTVRVTLTAASDDVLFSRFSETHIYVGVDPFPMKKKGKNMVPTVAPGQYTQVVNHDDEIATSWVYHDVERTFSGTIYVIVHWDSVFGGCGA